MDKEERWGALRGRAELVDGDHKWVAPPRARGHAMIGMARFLANGWARNSETSPDDAPEHTLRLCFRVRDQNQKLVMVIFEKCKSDIYSNMVFGQP